MTQLRPFAKYAKQFQWFTTVVTRLQPDYVGVAWSIAHREGLEHAIAFCETKIQDSQLMQAYRDSEF
jgi:hypothetical protein